MSVIHNIVTFGLYKVDKMVKGSIGGPRKQMLYMLLKNISMVIPFYVVCFYNVFKMCLRGDRLSPSYMAKSLLATCTSVASLPRDEIATPGSNSEAK